MLSISWNQFQMLYAVESLQGYTEEDIALLKEMFGGLPQVLEQYYRVAGRTKAFHQVQDHWVLPEDFQKWKWLHQSEYMILLNENQGVCRAGIDKKDLSLPDPPVYVTEDDQTWMPCTETVSEFLTAALAYEAVFHFAYSPEEFYCLTKEEEELLQSKLKKFPVALKNWLSVQKITFYQNAEDNLVAVMSSREGDVTMLYGAASAKSYQKLRTVLKEVGEPI